MIEIVVFHKPLFRIGSVDHSIDPLQVCIPVILGIGQVQFLLPVGRHFCNRFVSVTRIRMCGKEFRQGSFTFFTFQGTKEAGHFPRIISQFTGVFHAQSVRLPFCIPVEFQEQEL